MSTLTKSLVFGGLATLAAAHGTVTEFSLDGVKNGGFLIQYLYGDAPPEMAAWSAQIPDNGPVRANNIATADVICHNSAKPGALTKPVKAGGKIEFQWSDWPDSHLGPVITYMADCKGDCSSVNKEDLEFFKIDEAGLTNGQWAAEKLIADGDKWTSTVPANLAPGNYVVRHEIIALHQAGKQGGAELYPQCFNVKVTGSGSEKPTGVKGTELYSIDEEGIVFNLYNNPTSYPIPGPPLVSGGSTGGDDESKPVENPEVTATATASPTGTATATATAEPSGPACRGSTRRAKRNARRHARRHARSLY